MSISPTADLLQEALTLHRGGEFDGASAIYHEILRANPVDADANYYLGMISCQHGRFAEGAEFARKALASDASHVRAHVLLGRAAHALGQNDEALASLNFATGLSPDLSQAHSHRADILSDLGRHEEAVEAYDRALALAPESIEDWFNRGAALAAAGRPNEAIASFDRVIAGRPDMSQAHAKRGKALLAVRRHQDALESAARALALAPASVEALAIRGNVYSALARHDDAISAYEQALRLKPDFAEALIGRGNARVATGRPELAMDDARRALELGETAEARTLFVQCAQLANLPASDRKIRELLSRALAEGWTRPSELAGVCIALIRRDPHIEDCIASVNAKWPARIASETLIGRPVMETLTSDPLLNRVLRSLTVTDVGVERLLTNLRFLLLRTANEAIDERALGFYCALASQCFINEYIFSTTEAELAEARRLRTSLEEKLAAGDPCPDLLPVVAGAYFPLHSLTDAAALLERSWPAPVETLLLRQIREPAEERRIAATLPSLTEIRGASLAVRRQYEESPYPRWVVAGPPKSPPLLDGTPNSAMDVLVAGCGTGQFTVDFARSAPKSRFLAVDLSRASLSYAKRMADSLGVTNVEFAQADIMQLDSLGRKFDFIDVSGVLHHLADPWAGWRVLHSVLRPGGTMQVGLYSQLARLNVMAGRALISARGYQPVPDDIRRCREDIIANDDPLLRSLTWWPDFFTTSELRDLLFHVEEHRVTLPEIKSFLIAHDLEFAGFALPLQVWQKFAARFPDRSAANDLDCWHAFESTNPDTFAGMYQFFVRNSGSSTGELT